jgi:tRNA A37 threonylcarbamoyladenosine dehydratase
MSTNWPFAETQPDEKILVQGFPQPDHPAEPDLFARQVAMPGHDQARVEAAHILVVGCGGLGGWIALALARLGVRRLTLVDPDRFDRTNAPRQLVYADELGQPKAHAVARAIAPHMVKAGEIQAIATTVEDVTHRLESGPDALAVGVDNNAARLAASAYAQRLGIPAAS